MSMRDIMLGIICVLAILVALIAINGPLVPASSCRPVTIVQERTR